MSVIDCFVNIARQGAVSLSEAGNQVFKHSLKSPDCSRYRSFSLGLWKSVPLRGTFLNKTFVSTVQVEHISPSPGWDFLPSDNGRSEDSGIKGRADRCFALETQKNMKQKQMKAKT